MFKVTENGQICSLENMCSNLIIHLHYFLQT